MSSLGLNAFQAGCCCYDCPADSYCTSCGQTTDEAATYEVILEDWGIVDLSSCAVGAICDLSVINGTYSLAYTTNCTYYSDSISLGIDAFDCLNDGLDHTITITLYFIVDQLDCRCRSYLRLEVVLVSLSNLTFYSEFYNSDVRPPDCNDTFVFRNMYGTHPCTFGSRPLRTLATVSKI